MSTTRRTFAAAGSAALVAFALPAVAQSQPAKNRALFQVTDNDPARWNLVLNNMANLRDGSAARAPRSSSSPTGRGC